MPNKISPTIHEGHAGGPVISFERAVELTRLDEDRPASGSGAYVTAGGMRAEVHAAYPAFGRRVDVPAKVSWPSFGAVEADTAEAFAVLLGTAIKIACAANEDEPGEYLGAETITVDVPPADALDDSTIMRIQDLAADGDQDDYELVRLTATLRRMP